jgi:hypothetical protein
MITKLLNFELIALPRLNWREKNLPSLIFRKFIGGLIQNIGEMFLHDVAILFVLLFLYLFIFLLN